MEIAAAFIAGCGVGPIGAWLGFRLLAWREAGR